MGDTRHHDINHLAHSLDEAKRMAEVNVPPGAFFPSAAGPLAWQHAIAIAQVEQAMALNRIAAALEVIAFPAGGGR